MVKVKEVKRASQGIVTKIGTLLTAKEESSLVETLRINLELFPWKVKDVSILH